jgi:hypothetical protein
VPWRYPSLLRDDLGWLGMTGWQNPCTLTPIWWTAPMILMQGWYIPNIQNRISRSGSWSTSCSATETQSTSMLKPSTRSLNHL